MTKVQGDLIRLAQDGVFDVIVHGCNCHCSMDAGIAKSIKAVFPQAFEADCQTISGDRNKLGACSYAMCKTRHGIVTVVNAYTQYNWHGGGCLADYDAIRSCMAWVAEKYCGKRIGLPMIGAGFAGGEWNIIRQIIDKELGSEDVTIVEYSPSTK